MVQACDCERGPERVISESGALHANGVRRSMEPVPVWSSSIEWLFQPPKGPRWLNSRGNYRQGAIGCFILAGVERGACRVQSVAQRQVSSQLVSVTVAPALR